jgi:ketosteroid isomerase-like protein
MTEIDDFRNTTLRRQIEAEKALHNGDAGPRIQMWSTQDPVTLMGAETPCRSGWDEVSPVFHWLESRFSDLTDYEFEFVAGGVSGDLAYTVGFEHISVSVNGTPVPPIVIRVTHIYRREDGEWKIIHRHGDYPPADSAPQAEAAAAQ